MISSFILIPYIAVALIVYYYAFRMHSYVNTFKDQNTFFKLLYRHFTSFLAALIWPISTFYILFIFL